MLAFGQRALARVKEETVLEIDVDTFRIIVLASFCGTLIAALLFATVAFFGQMLEDGIVSTIFIILLVLGIVIFLAWPLLGDFFGQTGTVESSICSSALCLPDLSLQQNDAT